MSGPDASSIATGVGRRVFLALMAGAIGQVAFARRDPGDLRSRTIALLFDSLVSPFWVASIEAMRREATARGWVVLEAVSNMDDNRQYAQVQSMIQRGVDGIIIVHTDNKAVIPAIRAANAAGVPMVHFNRPPAESDAYSVAVVADNRKLMRQTVEALINKMRASGRRGKAAILLGDLSDANGLARHNGFEDAIAANPDAIEVVSRIATEWNADKAFAGLTNALQAHPDINMLVTSSDFMTPQIEQALRAAGKWHPAGDPRHILVAGFDGDSGGYAKLAEGYYDVDGVQDLEYEVRLSFEALEEMLAGKRPPKLLVDPGFVATREKLTTQRGRIWGYMHLQPEIAASRTNVVGPPAVESRIALSGVISAIVTFLAVLLSLAVLGDVALIIYPLLILVVGQMLVMLLGEIDLSMPAVLSLGSITTAVAMTGPLAAIGEPWTTGGGIAVCLGIGLAVGLFNGFCTAWLRMPSFIVTLAVMMIGSGVAVWYASTASTTISIGNLPRAFVAIGYGKVLSLPVSLLLAALVAVSAGWLLKRSIVGRWLYAIGHNRTAATISGVPTNTITLAAFALSGLCAGIACVIYTSRIETGQPSLGASMLLDVVGAAVIGGISLFGGRGTVCMALGGAAFLSILDKTLQLLGLSLFLVLGIKGLAIIIAAGADAWRNRSST
jgi:ribose/xylose/arabinose/galactoside ABC-type transport system permease subunit/ABC-type sugar transport system substrate-binding protein